MDLLQFLGQVGNGDYARVEIDLISKGYRLAGKAVVEQFLVDAFAAQLYAAVQAGTATPDLYETFTRCFPTANAGTLVGQ